MNDDLISRQAAIDAIMELIEARLEWKSDASREIKGLNAAYCAIEDLPAAQPEPCKDAVSRADVVDMLEMFPFTEYSEYETAREVVKRLPSAQPERNTGEWREHIFDGIMGRRPRALMCTNCNVISIYASNFCPNCGAKMGGSE